MADVNAVIPTLLSPNPTKRRNEIIVLLYSPLWIAVIAWMMFSHHFARWGDGGHLAFGIALALPLWIIPFAWRIPEERNRPLLELHATRFLVAIALMTFLQTYFGAMLFFDHLGMEYHFQVGWLLHGTPLFLYFVTIAYFSTYYVVLQIATRLVERRLPRALWLLARALLGYGVAFAETASMSTPALREFFFYRDKTFALLWGSACYGTLFFISLPLFQRLDDRSDAPPARMGPLVRDVLAANMLILILYELYGGIIGARV
jgi:cycloeucalenol cycloisomerase